MALTIKEEKGMFLLEGTLNAITALSFKNHIETIMSHVDDLVLNIENVTEIDTSGMNALRSIYTSALNHELKFHIVGTGCKEVYDDLSLNDVA